MFLLLGQTWHSGQGIGALSPLWQLRSGVDAACILLIVNVSDSFPQMPVPTVVIDEDHSSGNNAGSVENRNAEKIME